MAGETGSASVVFAEFILEGVERELSRARRPRNAAGSFKRITTALKGTAKGSSLYDIVTVEKITELKEKLRKERPQAWDESVEAAFNEAIAALEDDGEVELRKREAQEGAINVMRVLLMCTLPRCSDTAPHRLRHHSQMFRIIFEYLCYVPFLKRWRIGKQLGEGGHSTIRKCTHTYRYPGKTMALKQIHEGATNTFEIEMIRRETEVIRSLHHNHIPIVYDYDEEDGSHYLVLPLYRGGDMLGRIVEKAGHNFTEDTAAKLVKDLLESVEYLHSVHVVHRDIKPENVIFENTDDNSTLYLIDFGFAAKNVNGQSLTTSCGTPQYAAPEILNGLPHGSEVDMWSVGVVTYLILAGFPPFYDDDVDEMFKLIKQAVLEFPISSWSMISEEAKDFIQRLLTLDPSQRMTAKEALKHAWITNSQIRRNDHLGLVQEEAKKFRARSLWQVQEAVDKGEESYTVKNMRTAVNAYFTGDLGIQEDGEDHDLDLGLGVQTVRSSILEDPMLRCSVSKHVSFHRMSMDENNNNIMEESLDEKSDEETEGIENGDDETITRAMDDFSHTQEIQRLTRIIINQRMEITSLNEHLESVQKKLREYERKEVDYGILQGTSQKFIGENPMASFHSDEVPRNDENGKNSGSTLPKESSERKKVGFACEDRDTNSDVTSIISTNSISSTSTNSISSNTSPLKKPSKSKANLFTRMVKGASKMYTTKSETGNVADSVDSEKKISQRPSTQSSPTKPEKRGSIQRLGLHQSTAVFYTLHELASGAVEASIDPTRRELYLSDSEFMATFGMTKESFLTMSKWKQKKMKKENRLF